MYKMYNTPIIILYVCVICMTSSISFLYLFVVIWKRIILIILTIFLSQKPKTLRFGFYLPITRILYRFHYCWWFLSSIFNCSRYCKFLFSLKVQNMISYLHNNIILRFIFYILWIIVEYIFLVGVCKHIKPP